MLTFLYEKLVLYALDKESPYLEQILLKLAEEVLGFSSDSERLDKLSDIYFWFTWLKVKEACIEEQIYLRDIGLKKAVQNLLCLINRFSFDSENFYYHNQLQRAILELGQAIKLEAEVSESMLQLRSATKLLLHCIRGKDSR